jgi:predicted nucleotidyltransferase
MIDLEPAYLRKVKNILSGALPEFDVMVYGIRASGPAKKYSYLDLAVMSEKPLAAGRLEKLAAEFTAARFPFRVETVDWGASGKDFRKVIKKTGVVIQRSSKK